MGNSDDTQTPEAKIILSKCCNHNKIFGIRIEKVGNDWVRTWAFQISEAQATREGFDKAKITGSLKASPDFPGCPYCGSRGLLLCACGRASCYDGKSWSPFCYWCNTKVGNLSHSESFNVSAGAF